MLPRAKLGPRRGGALAAIAAFGATVLSGCGAAAHSSRSSDAGIPINVGAACGAAWAAPHGGALTFKITNQSSVPTDVYLRDPDTQKVYLEVEGFGSGDSTTERATLGNGKYQFVCIEQDEDPVAGPTTTISDAGTVSGATPGIVPVTPNDIYPLMNAYKTWVGSRLPVLRDEVTALQSAVAHGATAAAKADWLTAHMTYETLGAAYDLFGDINDAINGTPPAGITALDDRELTGFHRIEALLWSGAPAAQLTAATTTLKADVEKLIAQLPKLVMQPNDLALRAHEIVENAIQFELTGSTDAGSHTNLATVSANLVGSAKALSIVTPLLKTRYSQLAQTQQALADSQRLIDSFDKNGAWTPLSGLTTRQREQINASLDNTVELLAPVAAICDVRPPLGTL